MYHSIDRYSKSNERNKKKKNEIDQIENGYSSMVFSRYCRSFGQNWNLCPLGPRTKTFRFRSRSLVIFSMDDAFISSLSFFFSLSICSTLIISKCDNSEQKENFFFFAFKMILLFETLTTVFSTTTFNEQAKKLMMIRRRRRRRNYTIELLIQFIKIKTWYFLRFELWPSQNKNGHRLIEMFRLKWCSTKMLMMMVKVKNIDEEMKRKKKSLNFFSSFFFIIINNFIWVYSPSTDWIFFFVYF